MTFTPIIIIIIIIIIINSIVAIVGPAGISAVTAVTGRTGQSVQIKCPYRAKYKTNMKYLCKGKCSAYFWEMKDIPVRSGSEAKDQRFSLKDDTAAGVFTVIITNLTEGDAGTYWCGIERSNIRDIYTKILLLVTQNAPNQSETSPPLVKSLFSTKGIILSCVCVSLLALGTAFVWLFCKMRKTRDVQSSRTMPQREDGNTLQTDRAEFHSSSDSVYQSSNPNTIQSYSVYQSLNHNTIQSDSVYQSLNPSTNQSDSVYQTLNPNTNQSDSVYQSLQSTASKHSS